MIYIHVVDNHLCAMATNIYLIKKLNIGTLHVVCLNVKPVKSKPPWDQICTCYPVYTGVRLIQVKLIKISYNETLFKVRCRQVELYVLYLACFNQVLNIYMYNYLFLDEENSDEDEKQPFQ